ncbi:helix-turn-helix domain-containing protein [Pseudonocardia sp. C8]|uniref:PucR family transcriptional regulator n=1 Tax=Pseudonocardia sp. C8 TaxID=2762759 RepID=UPI00164265D1|nr:helix-turn-helix domain-containing protein [Pseudonocardia sp. C8]MBC3193359.1 helix-turn-helix domain-containing protein [Pseudonocardia sp. C8]
MTLALDARSPLRPVATDDERRPTLGQVLAEFGTDALDVLCAPPGGLAATVTRAHIWDASDADTGDAADSTLATGDLVLAVGLVPASPQLSRLIAAGRSAGVAAVAIRGPVNLAWVRTEAERAGVTVLVASRDLGWDQVHARLRVAIDTRPGTAGFAASAAEDLYAVANTAAAALGGPVEIDDAALRVLAFSNLPGELDDLRTRSILTRLPPEDFLVWLRETGTAVRIRHTDTPVRIDPPGNRCRLVMPVRAGIDVVGYVWVAEGDETLGPRHARLLVEVARVASAHLMRGGASQDPGRRARAELLARALDGRADTASLAAHLQVSADTRFALVGFRPRHGWRDPQVEPRYVRDQLELRGAVAARPGAGTVVDGGHVYGVVPVPAGGTPADDGAGTTLVATAREVVTLIGNQLGVDLVAAVDTPGRTLDGLVDSRGDVDRALSLLAEDRSRTVATCGELRPQVTLALLRELARDRPQLLSGPVVALAELDRTRRTDYLATLRAYFDAASDLSDAARILFVHRNTLRYRLRRIQELSGLDLSDPAERLVAELQLRLLEGSGERPQWTGNEQRASG